MARVIEDARAFNVLAHLDARHLQPIHAQRVFTACVNDQIRGERLVLSLIVHGHAGDYGFAVSRAVLS